MRAQTDILDEGEEDGGKEIGTKKKRRISSSRVSFSLMSSFTSLIGITTSPSVSVTFVSDVSRIRCTHFDLKRSLESCWLCSWSLSPSLLFSLHSSLGYLIYELLRAPLLTGLHCNSVRNPLASVCSSLSSKIFIRLASFR